MKKVLFALLAVAMLASCNNDDDSNKNQKFMTSVSINGDVAVFQYDEKKNLKSISSDGDIIYGFNYDGSNNLISVTDGDDAFVTLQYENGQLESITNGDAVLPVTYNEATKKYLIGGAGIEVGLSGKDIATVDETGGDNLLALNYSSDNKGPFYSVPTRNVFLLPLLLELHYFMSTKPITQVTENGTTYTTENTYDEDGYVTQMVMKSGTEIQGTIIFQYSKL
ncbi:MAG: hypothetical protein DI539_05690 [Flavobacterium psychrophilum]|nr:MAG: hypothetical protein DI539_05690 [Flavobacterium psychrophilum]